MICDRDAVIACAGVPRKDYTDKKLSDELEQVIESRSLYFYKDDDTRIPVLAEGGNHYVSCAMPIISEGDIVGCVASVTDGERDMRREIPASEVESKLILTAAGFLGRQLES